MQNNYNIRFPNREFSLTDNELENFGEMIGIKWKVKGKYSKAFLLDLYCHNELYGINPEEVLEAIKEEENNSKIVGIKAATEFKRFPLKGLWHKHYYSARFIAQNIKNQLARGGLEKIVKEVFDPKISPVATKEMIEELSYRVVHETLDKRKNIQKMTGEWIIFAKHKGENYYLCMGTHHNEDQEIRKKIELLCSREFPFLNDILATE
ncbi:hypothetical protein [Litorilituus sediminis]|uniref:Uncharacterized protein n=1 Tax=Litorilituus sediminis TaxID=718192 RepID=A0A4P6PCN9_9GAMM|nr:hypothetical protein [Litorilituus sediminis]QBG37532.1 hypothetical protein EMK97_18215 [Litorilituus sediminis]